MHMKGILFAVFFFFLVSASYGSVSVNVPLNHWSYAALDKLVSMGFVDSSLLGTKPFSRLEMGRLIGEALEKRTEDDEEADGIVVSLLKRLRSEFQEELSTLGILDGTPVKSFIKPVEDLYFKYVYGDEEPDLENQRGDIFAEGSNYRVGFSSRMKFWDHVAFYINPEFRYQEEDGDWDEDVKIVEGYSKLDIMNLEIEVGRDSLWWGPGYHGSMLMSNNAEPFDLVKISNSRPILLPWLFRHMGPFNATLFLTELEDEREIPEAKLTGMRLNFKPYPLLELGLSRTIMFDGEGRKGLDIGDFWKVFWASEENKPGRLNNNQLGSVDFSFRIPRINKILPVLSSIIVYGELAGEDEAGGFFSRTGYLSGLFLGDLFLTGRTDLRMEYANNHVPGHPNLWYSHSVYKSGYTYEDRVIGHHMGSDADSFFIRLTHYLSGDLVLGLQFVKERGGLSNETEERTRQWILDLSFFRLSCLQLTGSYSMSV